MYLHQWCGIGVEAGVGVGLSRQFWLDLESLILMSVGVRVAFVGPESDSE